MAETKIFESELKNGVKYEIHEAYGFSGRVELAIIIGGEVISIVSVEKKLKSGNIQCRSLQNRIILIPKDGKAVIQEEKELPGLDDVIQSDPTKVAMESADS